MRPQISTGPALVGLQTPVLPAFARVSRRMAGASVLVRAPHCSVGSAGYTMRLWSPSHRRTRHQYVEISSTLRSGRQIVQLVPDDWNDIAIVLDLVQLHVAPGALWALTADQLIDALSHPLEVVREAAMCAVHRVRSA